MPHYHGNNGNAFHYVDISNPLHILSRPLNGLIHNLLTVFWHFA